MAANKESLYSLKRRMMIKEAVSQPHLKQTMTKKVGMNWISVRTPRRPEPKCRDITVEITNNTVMLTNLTSSDKAKSGSIKKKPQI